MPHLPLLLALTIAATPLVSTAEPGTTRPCLQATRSVVVQPIVVCNDDGRQPATMRIMEPLIDQVYAKADVDFHFLEPLQYHCRKARDGEINLDQIVRESRQAGMLRGEGTMLHMLFVNAVDGRKGPLGRGQQNGSVLFICLGDKPNRAMEAFVVAHEAGHNLNLRHAVDDENVPNDVPNLMGDGPFEQRVGPDGLTDYQVGEIHKSRLVNKRVLCLDVEQGRRAIVDESFEPYFSQLQRAEIATLTGVVPTGDTLDACRQQARERFQEAVLPFTDREAEAVSLLVEQLEGRVRADYPLLARQPWRFIKTANHLCGGFFWTRGLCIVLNQRKVEHILATRNNDSASALLDRHGPLLFHEQMHVLQRVYPSRFAGLYTDVFGFLQANVQPCAWLTQRQMTNPDAVRLEWIFATGKEEGPEKYVWPRTILNTTEGVPRMGRDFELLAVEVQKDDTNWRVKSQDDGTPMHDPQALAVLAHRFPVANGLDHPNEIAAYMSSRLVFAEAKGRHARDAQAAVEPAPGSEIERRFAEWCRDNLR